MRSCACLVLCALLVAGCGSVAPIPSDTFYRLEVPPAPQPLARPWCTDPITVPPLQASGLLKERALVESDGAGVTLRQIRYHYWLDTPEHLLKDGLVAYLRALRAAPIVLGDAGAAAALEIDGRVLRFERVKDAKGTRVRAALELVLRDRRHARVLFAKEYDRTSDVRGDAASDAVAALAASVGAIYGDFTADADRLLSGQPWSAQTAR